MKKLTVIVEKTDTGFSAYIKEMDGVISVGATMTELKDSLNEGLFHEIEYINETEGKNISVSDFELNYTIDLKQFFDYFKVINKSAFAEDYLDINKSLFRQYTKGLAPLSDKKVLHISRGLHKLANELEDVTFIAN